ncbi:MAG TPA: MFS transporter [Fibrobacteria bacterium]|nr:MFS transporter [Fibrobacteria bacterium]
MNKPSRAAIAAVSFGMVSGLPSDLMTGTLQVRLSDAGLKASDIGYLGLATMPLMLKPFWAPVVDRFAPPTGRRRGWIFLATVCVTLALGLLGGIDPNSSRNGLVACLALAAFFSATVDLAVNGWTCDMSRIGASRMAGLSVWGFRAAMLLSSSLSLVMAQRIGWQATYWLLAGIGLLGLAAGYLHPEPDPPGQPPLTLSDAVVKPVREFLRDSGASGFLLLLLFALLFRLADSWAANQTSTFLQKSGFTKDELSLAKGVALVGAGVGVWMAGWLETRLRVGRLLVVAGILGAASNLGFLLVSESVVPRLVGLHASQIIESVCGGLLSAVFVGYLMSRCGSGSAATQYAILTSVWLLGRYLTAPAGAIADSSGWTVFFVASTLAAVPGLFLVPFLARRARQGDTATSGG